MYCFAVSYINVHVNKKYLSRPFWIVYIGRKHDLTEDSRSGDIVGAESATGMECVVAYSAFWAIMSIDLYEYKKRIL